jgi:FkbM family methyltransferase
MKYKQLHNKGGPFFEELISLVYDLILTEGDICIDGGANTGSHLFPMSKKVGNNGMVIGFEAISHLCSHLKYRSKGIKQIKIVEGILTNYIGKSNFCVIKEANGYSGIFKRYGIPREFEDSLYYLNDVNTTTIDSTVSKLNIERKVKFIKLDLEGGEFHALQGSIDTLLKDRPVVIYEDGGLHTAKTYSYSIEEFDNLFEKTNYTTYDIFGRVFSYTNNLLKDKPWYTIALPSEKIVSNNTILQRINSFLPKD